MLTLSANTGSSIGFDCAMNCSGPPSETTSLAFLANSLTQYFVPLVRPTAGAVTSMSAEPLWTLPSVHGALVPRPGVGHIRSSIRLLRCHRG